MKVDVHCSKTDAKKQHYCSTCLFKLIDAYKQELDNLRSDVKEKSEHLKEEVSSLKTKLKDLESISTTGDLLETTITDGDDQEADQNHNETNCVHGLDYDANDGR